MASFGVDRGLPRHLARWRRPWNDDTGIITILRGPAAYRKIQAYDGVPTWPRALSERLPLNSHVAAKPDGNRAAIDGNNARNSK